MKMYGIPNCDTIKKARTWLTENNIAYEFHDFKKLGITKQKLKEWSKQVGVEKLLNKQSSTWRTLTPEQQSAIATQTASINLMAEKPSIIKRPVLETENTILVGFNAEDYYKIFKTT